jgi:hypothetical protein
MINLQAVSKLATIGLLAYHSEEIRTAYLAAQARAVADVRDMPPSMERVNLLARRWLEYFYDEYRQAE